MATHTLAQALRRRALSSILAGMILLLLTLGASTQVVALAHSRVTPSKGQFSEFPLPTGSGAPFGITAGPDGDLWFTEQSAQIGKLNPKTGKIGQLLP